MKIGLSMLYCINRPFSEMLKILEEIDVKNVEIIDEGPHSLNEERIREIRRISYERDLEISVHSPFIDVNIASTSSWIRQTSLKRLKKSILLSGELDSPLWVFHPGLKNHDSYFYSDLNWEMNLKSVRELLAFAKKRDVRITIENGLATFSFLLSSVEDFDRFYNDLGEEELGLTLDIGHANINGQIFKFIDRYAEKIVHTHLHDNHGTSDEHLGVGKGNIDWAKVIQALDKKNYKGALIIESEKDIEYSLEKIRSLIYTSHGIG